MIWACCGLVWAQFLYVFEQQMTNFTLLHFWEARLRREGGRHTDHRIRLWSGGDLIRSGGCLTLPHPRTPHLHPLPNLTLTLTLTYRCSRRRRRRPRSVVAQRRRRERGVGRLRAVADGQSGREQGGR